MSRRAMPRSRSTTTQSQEAAYQAATVNACTRAQWMSEVQPYNGSVVGDAVGNIVIGGKGAPDNRANVLSAFCSDNKSARACQ
jgi:hypothetical protein